MNLLNNPCDRYCPDRHIGCHAECEKYIQAKKAHDELLKKIRKDVDIKGYMARTATKKKERYLKKRK